jgi:hypothetical protein
MSRTRYHLTADQSWMRCRAVKRKGQGVSLCPIGDRSHVIGRQGIAAHGGGPEVRTENGERVTIFISAVDADGTFTADTPTGRRSVYTASGLLMRLRDRARAKEVHTV